MIFNAILPGAWELTQDVQYNLFTLRVPLEWQQVAQSLAKERVKKGYAKYPSVPVYSLDPIVAGSFPKIVQTMRYGWQKEGLPWLLAKEKADLSYLPELIKDWLKEEFSHCLGDAQVDAWLNNLNNNAWRWDEDPTTYSLQHPPQNRSDIEIRFQAIPDYLALKFLENPTVSFEGDIQHQLTFYRVVSLKGAELMSWPPYPVPLINEKKERVGTAKISFVIRFTLQTVPWRKKPLVYHQLSTRLWVAEPLKPLPYRGATVYIGDNRRWLDGVRQPFCFISVPIKQNEQKARWPRAISNLLLSNDSQLPDPNTLALEPAYNWPTFGEHNNGIQAAIAYDSRHRGKIPCLRGISPRDLTSLERAIQDRLPVKRVGEAVKVSGTVAPFWEPGKPKKKGDKSPKDPNDLSTIMLRPNIAAPAVFCHPNHPLQTILILWETPQCRDALIAQICQLLCLSPKGEAKPYQTSTGSQGEEQLYEGELGSLCIRTQHVEDLSQKLDIDNPSATGKTRQQRRVNLLSERIHQISSFLPPSEGLSGALVEIKPKKSFFIPESDPKLAWRIGAMQAGYLNQHIHAVTGRKKTGEEYVLKSAENRVKKAVSDLLRQFGILPIPLIKPEELDGIGQNLWLTCFYALRRTRKTTASNQPSTVALMVRVNPVTGIVELTTPTLFKEQGWVSYPVGLGYLLQEKWDVDSYFEETTVDLDDEQPLNQKKQEQQLLNKFVTDCLRDCLNTPIEQDKSPYVLFMVEAHNARKLLTWPRNPDVPANDLPSELKLTESESNRLWVVRLRTYIKDEVPAGIVKDNPGSRTCGVFRWQDVCDDTDDSPDCPRRKFLYLSMRKLLTTEQDTLRKSQSRLDNGSRQAANPRLLEIAPIHHPDIDSDKLATFVHSLRERWPYFADYVALPFPFPFATNAKEYAVSAKDAVEPDFSDEEEIESEEEVEIIQLSLFEPSQFLSGDSSDGTS
ncbi:MAG: DUF3962 domain-containing protein [Hydrococcus sp. Prado102]|jgi:hypothetical protein|nr:DUF3962 domain-containing protein [Hydrococcus sp. Prado102]